MYIMRAMGTTFFKIGVTKSPSSRLNAVNTHCPFRVKYVDVINTSPSDVLEVEWETHELFRENRMNGEWFNLEPFKIKNFVELIYPKVFYSRWEPSQNRTVYFLEESNDDKPASN